MSTPPSACDKQNSDKSDSFEKQANKNKEIVKSWERSITSAPPSGMTVRLNR